ncbi:MAG: endoglucanase [Chloroflexi bacterium]|nr:MAG: endoglucanase [Chloroflexota bacterium]MBA4376201.1 aminopeptidase [Anaerolinea sp.]
MKALLQKLTETASPSGFEDKIRDLIRSEISAVTSSVKVDTLGNLIVTIGEKTVKGMRVMVAAHMDEIGLMVSHVEKNGLVRFTNIGAIFPRYLSGNRAIFLNGVTGCINNDRPDDLTKIQSIEKYFIDIGATSDKDCPVKIGDVAAIERGFVDLGKRVVSKSLDNRSSCAVLIETIQNIKNTPHELVFVFSAQEEVGVRGAQTAAYDIDADLGLAIDVTPTGDILGVKMQVSLGNGPAIKVRDQGMISDPRVVRWIEETARKNKIPYQMEVLEVGSTDARIMQVSKAGMFTGAVSIPCRYVHSPSEMVDMDDLNNTVKLLSALLSNPILLK